MVKGQCLGGCSEEAVHLHDCSAGGGRLATEELQSGGIRPGASGEWTPGFLTTSGVGPVSGRGPRGAFVSQYQPHVLKP